MSATVEMTDLLKDLRLIREDLVAKRQKATAVLNGHEKKKPMVKADDSK